MKIFALFLALFQDTSMLFPRRMTTADWQKDPFKKIQQVFNSQSGLFSDKKMTISKTFDRYSEEHEAKMKQVFADFKREFDKHWSPEEEKLRLGIFGENVKKIWEHNSLNSKTFEMGINEFSDLTDQEFQSQYIPLPLPVIQNPKGTPPPLIEGLEKPKRLLQTSNPSNVSEILSSLPKKVDWSLQGKVSPVKHQKNCQGCYVFSALAALESAIAIRYNTIIPLSEQELIDCSYSYRNGGCRGGQPQFVFDYIIANGANLEENYLFTSREGQCKAPTYKGVFKLLRKYFKPEPNVISLIQYLQYGPVVVNHYVPPDFKYYFQGIYSTPQCENVKEINHSSIVVGYDLESPKPFFKLKNSWGLKWGEDGFYKVHIGELSFDNPGFCSMANNGYNVFPTLFE